MLKVAVIGCGIVGAAIAYELSQLPGLVLTVFDRQAPAQASTGAALGVLMGAISQKLKGNNLRMRLASIQRYNEWIPQLEAMSSCPIPYNQQGILRLCFEGEDLTFWQNLAAVRHTQGWRLQILDRAQLATDYPYLNLDRVIGAVYSPDDRQVDPVALTFALVAAAEKNGATFHFNTPITEVDCSSDRPRRCQQVHTAQGTLAVDDLVIAAGLGSVSLTTTLQQPLDLRPVLGQAVQLRLAQKLGSCLQPVVTGKDVNLVPLGKSDYWVGATVELANPSIPDPLIPDPSIPNAVMLKTLMEQAIALCPILETAETIRTWFGLRPRPEGRPAPIVELLQGYENVWLATGHYRNGVLLAPATAAQVKAAIVTRRNLNSPKIGSPLL